VLAGTTSCELLLPVADSSVRVVCTLENPDGNMFSPMGALAFDSNGRSRGWWPVDAHFDVAGRMVGDDLTLLAPRSLGDVVEPGKPTTDVGLVIVAADAALRNGARVPMDIPCCKWAVGPEGVAYGAGWLDWPTDGSRVTAVGISGMLSGWPVNIDGIASEPAFGPGGRIDLTIGSFVRTTSRVLAFDRTGKALSATSAELPIATVRDGGVGGCNAEPKPPLIAQNGTIFVHSEVDTAIFALDPSLKVMPGWPYRPATPLARPRPGYESEQEAGFCPSLSLPAVGPDSTLYLALQARDSTVGGSLVAVGPDGRVRPGWPVGLKRAGSEFWSVVVGSDGTAYALAIEPESSTSSSATILAIAPDSTVRYATTIIEP